MATESTGKDVGIRRGQGYLLANKTGRYGGGIAIESLEELVTLDPLPTLIAILNDLRTQFNAHCADGTTAHTVADATNPVTAAVCTNEATAYTLANALKTGYEAHRVLTTSSVHDGADSTNTIAAANATTLATLVTLTEELLVDYEAHRVNVSTCHDGADVTNVATVAKYAGATCTKAKFPAGSWGLGVSHFCKETMATAVNYDLGTAGALTSYVSNSLDTTGLAVQSLPSGSAILPYTSETALVVTPDVTPTSRSGRVYVQIHFMRLRALTGGPNA